MAKYSYELKKKVVEAYHRNEGSYEYLAKKYGITNKRQVLNWVQAYDELGNEGLLRSRQNNNYSFEYKLHMVELYLSSETSYQELALSEGIKNSSLIVKWVNDFRIAGPDALRAKKKGRKKTLGITSNKSEVKFTETTSVDTGAKHIKELEDELLRLRIENAFLKELRRLRLEDEAKTRELHELSTVSEENSN